MTTREFSEIFGMSVREMCELLGMSRQGLNEIVRGRSKKPSAKKRNALHDLRDKATQMRFLEINEVQQRYEERMKAAEIFDAVRIDEMGGTEHELGK